MPQRADVGPSAVRIDPENERIGLSGGGGGPVDH